MTKVTIIDLIRMSLKDIGATGLCNSDIECGCEFDDLCPCGEPNLTNCIAGISSKNLAKKYNAYFWIVPLPEYRQKLKPILNKEAK